MCYLNVEVVGVLLHFLKLEVRRGLRGDVLLLRLLVRYTQQRHIWVHARASAFITLCVIRACMAVPVMCGVRVLIDLIELIESK